MGCGCGGGGPRPVPTNNPPYPEHGDTAGQWEVIRPDGMRFPAGSYWDAVQRRAMYGGSIRQLDGGG